MSRPGPVSLQERLALRSEALFMSYLVPKRSVGPLYRVLFKGPLLLKKLGLGCLIPRNILILTTHGRHTGRVRQTTMEFSQGPSREVLLVMAGLAGNTDWYKNARADPRVRVWRAGREWPAIAEPVPDADVARLLEHIIEMDPLATRMFSRWSDVQIDGSKESYLVAARSFPSLYLRPVKAEAA